MAWSTSGRISAINGASAESLGRVLRAVSVSRVRQHFLYFFPLPHRQGSFRPMVVIGVFYGKLVRFVTATLSFRGVVVETKILAWANGPFLLFGESQPMKLPSPILTVILLQIRRTILTILPMFDKSGNCSY